MTTPPVAMPMRTSTGGDVRVVLLDDVEGSAYRPFGGVLVGVRVAKVCDHPVADVLGDHPSWRETIVAQRCR